MGTELASPLTNPVEALISLLGLAATQSVIPWADWVCGLLAGALAKALLTGAPVPKFLGKPMDPVLTGKILAVAGCNKVGALIFI